MEIKGTVCYQATATVGQKAIHKNYTHEEVTAYITDCLEDGFSQLQIQGQRKDASVLVSKKGKQTMKVKQHPALEPVKIMAHNRVKQYILKEGIPVPFLVDLGVMNAQAKSTSTLMTNLNRSTVFWNLSRISFRHFPESGRSRFWILLR